MRVLAAAFEYPPLGSGIARVAGEVVPRLRAAGHEVTVLSVDQPGIKTTWAAIQGYGALAIARYWGEVWEQVRPGSFDVAWLHNPMLPRPLRVPAVATVHTTYLGQRRGDPPHGWRSAYYAMAERLEERRFRALRPEAWTTVGDAVAVELRELGIDEPMADISNGADLVRFHPKHRGAARRRLQLATDDRLVVCIGRLESVKGHESLLRAWSVHKAAGGRGRLAIIGSGTMHQRIADLLARTPIPDAALLGRLSDADKDAHLHAADLVAVPSLYEGQPLAALEALAAGVPVLGNRIPHLAFVARAGAGAVTDFADPAAAAAALAGWLGNAKRWERASHDGRAYAEREFDWDRITARYEERLAAVASAR